MLNLADVLTRDEVYFALREYESAVSLPGFADMAMSVCDRSNSGYLVVHYETGGPAPFLFGATHHTTRAKAESSLDRKRNDALIHVRRAPALGTHRQARQGVVSRG